MMRESWSLSFYERETRVLNEMNEDIFCFYWEKWNYFSALVCYFLLSSLPLDENRLYGWDLLLCSLDNSCMPWISTHVHLGNTGKKIIVKEIILKPVSRSQNRYSNLSFVNYLRFGKKKILVLFASNIKSALTRSCL